MSLVLNNTPEAAVAAFQNNQVTKTDLLHYLMIVDAKDTLKKSYVSNKLSQREYHDSLKERHASWERDWDAQGIRYKLVTNVKFQSTPPEPDVIMKGDNAEKSSNEIKKALVLDDSTELLLKKANAHLHWAKQESAKLRSQKIL